MIPVLFYSQQKTHQFSQNLKLTVKASNKLVINSVTIISKPTPQYKRFYTRLALHLCIEFKLP